MSSPAVRTQYMVTKNTKFEAKLARYLISKPGDQLLGYDACIEKQGKSINYRLIVLGLESLYLSDNPPKTAQLEKPFIHYRDILRAEIIDDYPDFLFGNEKTNALHMRLRVIMPSNKSKKDRNKKSKSINAEDMDTIPSLMNPFILENINSYMEPITPRRTTSNHDVYQASLPQLSAAIPFLLSSPSTATLGKEPLSSSRRTDELSASGMGNASLEFQERLEDLNLDTDRSTIQSLLSTPRTLSNEQRLMLRSKSAKASSKKKINSDSSWNSDSPRFNRYALQVHKDDRYGTLHTPRSTSRGTPRSHMNDDMTLSTARSTLTDLSYTSSMTLSATNSEESAIYCPSVEEVRSLRDDIAEDMREVDIYFLSLNAKIPEILSAALSNYVVIATLRFQSDPEFSILSHARLQYSVDVTMTKFSQLKTEILHSYKNPNQLIGLTGELCTACDRYPQVKELFWKDQDLFVYYIAELNTCSQAISKNEFDDSTIDVSFSIMGLLNEVFLNTFVSTERQARVTDNQCSQIQVLANCLLTPPIALLPTVRTTSDGSGFNDMLKNAYRTVLKWMFMSTSLLWHIGDIVRRPSWTTKIFRFRHFIESFEQVQLKDEYFELFIDAITRMIINNEKNDPLSPKHALYVYQFFSILSMLLANSTILSQYIRDQYVEDFKYFLKEEAILSRIPVQYPVYRFIPELIRDVRHRILYGEPKIDLSTRAKHHQLI
ncbi:unnamed protein product [Rotaria socialis]|uniref:Uncharacterized protein n=1 Tax=Rotaria socialis TaxID=392032 RepID=A0A818D0H0_9BILA|nr:unnamed protein product [Rotaria socialis]CAF3370860.1 unnamed protein product [Rotaria socialis]CAF3437047.1 unnamed protein product [Rotaria socialis]CAF3581038.1 unnamed protein product [Rotaria socialis]CAF3669853.1 unnamed protein product [Rotaria socialis]